MYETNSQAWDRISAKYDESIRQTKIIQEMFGQDNLKGLSEDQRAAFYRAL